MAAVSEIGGEMGMGRARSGGGPGVGLLELLTELNYGLTWAKAAHGAALFSGGAPSWGDTERTRHEP